MMPPARSLHKITTKRLFDLILIAALSGPLLMTGVLVALWIKLASKGPVLFRQERCGLRGAPIIIYKFRTMVVNADTESHRRHVQDLVRSGRALTKLDSVNDPRLIPGARFLRNSGLDELPQLLNVLQGDLSLVGPRPCLPEEHALFPPAHRERFETLPGITGYWQVSGKNGTTFDEMVALDVHYVRNRSVWLDASIVLRTPGVLARQLLCSSRKPALASTRPSQSCPPDRHETFSTSE